jgi:predicted nucleic acid-binding protein
MTGPCFVDTNVLVYSRDRSEKKKQPLADAWRQALWRTGKGRLSIQVLNEYYQVVTRKLSPGLPRADARAELRDLWHWQPIPLNQAVIEAAYDAEDRWSLSYWDALIVAAAMHAECEVLLSEDLSAGQVYDGLQVVNPFAMSPDQWLG